uniref:Uncharacterized protein n=1 Tax=Arundo donax TaxID=35708 RepID=A0A0A9ELL4_ARUDO
MYCFFFSLATSNASVGPSMVAWQTTGCPISCSRQHSQNLQSLQSPPLALPKALTLPCHQALGRARELGEGRMARWSSLRQQPA